MPTLALLLSIALRRPANRLGCAAGWSGGQLKVAQEAISLTVFGILMVGALGEPVGWRHFNTFMCILAACAFLFLGK